MLLLEVIDPTTLRLVIGGAEIPALGRCGPGASWGFLGDVYTSECRAHDTAVRGGLQGGSSRFMAHVRALPLLPAAVGSYVKKVTGL